MDHTPRDSALHLLGLFVLTESEPGEYVNAAMLDYTFSQEGWSAADYRAGLDYCVEEGWVHVGTLNRMCATVAGLEAAAAASAGDDAEPD